jgi:hypothetical protein
MITTLVLLGLRSSRKQSGVGSASKSK